MERVVEMESDVIKRLDGYLVDLRELVKRGISALQLGFGCLDGVAEYKGKDDGGWYEFDVLCGRKYRRGRRGLCILGLSVRPGGSFVLFEGRLPFVNSLNCDYWFRVIFDWLIESGWELVSVGVGDVSGTGEFVLGDEGGYWWLSYEVGQVFGLDGDGKLCYGVVGGFGWFTEEVLRSLLDF